MDISVEEYVVPYLDVQYDASLQSSGLFLQLNCTQSSGYSLSL